MDYIPIVDLVNVNTENSSNLENWKEVAKKIKEALSGIGFVYLVNHGLDQAKIDNAFKQGKTFFELPTVVKEKYTKNASKSFHGYAQPGQELLHPDSTFELRESWDFSGIGTSRFYPREEVPEFERANKELQEECKPLIHTLLRVIATSLELDDEEFFINRSKHLDDTGIATYSALRTMYYPPVTRNIPVGAVRCAEHSDYGILTLLFQDDIGGLEVKTVNGEWVAAKPIAGSILVNTGDLLEFWTGGLFPATRHRVLVPAEEIRKGIPRQSMVYFFHPDNSALVSPLKNSATSESYQPVSAGEHAKRRLEKSYQY